MSVNISITFLRGIEALYSQNRFRDTEKLVLSLKICGLTCFCMCRSCTAHIKLCCLPSSKCGQRSACSETKQKWLAYSHKLPMKSWIAAVPLLPSKTSSHLSGKMSRLHCIWWAGIIPSSIRHMNLDACIKEFILQDILSITVSCLLPLQPTGSTSWGRTGLLAKLERGNHSPHIMSVHAPS